MNWGGGKAAPHGLERDGQDTDGFWILTRCIWGWTSTPDIPKSPALTPTPEQLQYPRTPHQW